MDGAAGGERVAIADTSTGGSRRGFGGGSEVVHGGGGEAVVTRLSGRDRGLDRSGVDSRAGGEDWGR